MTVETLNVMGMNQTMAELKMTLKALLQTPTRKLK
jgi:hypothetical protein